MWRHVKIFNPELWKIYVFDLELLTNMAQSSAPNPTILSCVDVKRVHSFHFSTLDKVTKVS